MQIATVKKVLNYQTLYFIALLLLVVSLPLSKFTMSLFQFGTLFFWLWHGVDIEVINRKSDRKKSKFSRFLTFCLASIQEVLIALYLKFLDFFRNKPAMVIASILLMHVIGLIYTNDFHYALKDLRTKLPIFILPLFISTGPRLSNKQLYVILLAFVAAVLGGTFYQTALYIKASIADTRAIWAHVSHIRFSLNAVFAVFVLLFFVFSDFLQKKSHRLLLLLPAIWIAAFLFYLNYTTGMILLASLLAIASIFGIFRIKKQLIKYTLLLTLFIGLSSTGIYFYKLLADITSPPTVYFTQLESKTKLGNYYYHDTVNFRLRDGKWEGLYICEKEMREEWAKKSSLNLDSLGTNKQLLRYTLIKYLSSKGLRKDRDGMLQLTSKDIANIENGMNTSDFSSRKKIRTQIEDFIAGLKNYQYHNNPNEGSLIQRFEYWKTALQIIKQHPIVGVGTGDVPAAFEQQYEKMNSNLSIHNRHRSHNQYLSITVAFGVIGLIWFLFALVYPGIKTKGFGNYFYFIYWVILMVSMLTEDTIESQEGVTFFALFTSLFLLSRIKIGEPLFCLHKNNHSDESA